MMHPLIPWLIVLPLLVFWLWMFWDMTNNERLISHPKLTWLAVFVFLNVFGAALYYSTEYRNRY
jgi:hypothetical protein